MFEQQKPFGETLAGLMRAKKLSAKRLAGLAGYKSKTSIVRILREESVHSGRERLFARMDELGLLTPDERQALLRGLEFSRVGGDRAMARLGLRRLLTGEWNARAPAPALANALESLRAAHSARILLLNGCHPEVVLPLRDILRKRPAHAMEHFVTVGASARQDMDALCAILSIAFVPAYACALQDTQAPDGLSTRQDALCFTAQDRDGVGTDTLILFPGGEDAVIHTQPAAHGLFSSSARPLPGTISAPSFPPARSGMGRKPLSRPCAFARSWSAAAMRASSSRISASMRSTGHSCAQLCWMVAHCANSPTGTSGSCVRVLRNSFITTTSAFRTTPAAHMPTGRSYRRVPCVILPSQGACDSHFSTIRPFTVEERIAILEGAMQRMRANRGHLHALLECGGQPGHGSALP